MDSQIIGQIDTIRRPQSRSKGFQKIIRNSFKEIVESISENKAQRIYLTFKTSKLRWSAIEWNLRLNRQNEQTRWTNDEKSKEARFIQHFNIKKSQIELKNKCFRHWFRNDSLANCTEAAIFNLSVRT